jgi:hypothetical protein
MPLSHLHRYPILYWTVVGDVVYAQGIEVTKESLRMARESGRVRWHILADLIHSTENRSTDELQGIAATIGANRDFLSGRLAIVAREPLVYGNSRIFRVLMQDYDVDVRIFATVAKAEQWMEDRNAP